MVMVVSWSHIILVVIMMTEFWVSLVVDVVLNIWFFMVVLVHNDWDIVDICVVAIIMMDVMMFIVMMSWLVHNLVVDFMMHWLMHKFVVLLMVYRGAVVDFVCLMMHWHIVMKVVVKVVNLVMWLLMVVVHVPLGVVVNWVEINVLVGVMIVVSPGVVVRIFVMRCEVLGVVMNVVSVSPSVLVVVMVSLMMVVVMVFMVPRKVMIPVVMSHVVWRVPLRMRNFICVMLLVSHRGIMVVSVVIMVLNNMITWVVRVRVPMLVVSVIMMFSCMWVEEIMSFMVRWSRVNCFVWVNSLMVDWSDVRGLVVYWNSCMMNWCCIVVSNWMCGGRMVYWGNVWCSFVVYWSSMSIPKMCIDSISVLMMGSVVHWI